MLIVLFAQPTVYEAESKCSSSICWRNESPAVLLLWSAQDGSLERAQLMTHAELQADTASFFLSFLFAFLFLLAVTAHT